MSVKGSRGNDGVESSDDNSPVKAGRAETVPMCMDRRHVLSLTIEKFFTMFIFFVHQIIAESLPQSPHTYFSKHSLRSSELAVPKFGKLSRDLLLTTHRPPQVLSSEKPVVTNTKRTYTPVPGPYSIPLSFSVEDREVSFGHWKLSLESFEVEGR